MLVQRAMAPGVRGNFTSMGFSNMVWALGKARFHDIALMQQLLGMVYFGERPPEGPGAAVDAGEGGGDGEAGEGGRALPHLALSAFNALDLCNCLAGISLFRVHVARTAAPVQGAQV